MDNAPATATPEGAVHIAFVAMTTTAPQALINQKYNVFDAELAKLGVKVTYTASRSLDNVYPLMDREEGAPDFVYIPHSAFTTYTTKTSKFGGGDKFAIVAGSLDLSDIDLVTRPAIASIRDLAGKTIAISNLRYSDEFQLNKLLATVGLQTETLGGNVKVVWADTVWNTLESYGNGRYDGVIVFNTDNRDLAIAKVPGSQVYALNPPGLYGGKHPRVWLVANKELIRNEPSVVRNTLKAHIVLGERARKEIASLAAINRETFLAYFEKRGAFISEKHPLERFEERWNSARITYDPNMDFIRELFAFLERKRLTQGMTIDDFAQITPLNEALKELGRPEVPR